MAKQSSDGSGSPRPEQPRRLSALDRAIQAAIGDGRTVGRGDDPAAEKFPDLWQWLTLTTDPAHDYVMQPAVVTVQLGPEGVLVSLTHRDLKVTCAVACLHLEEMWEVLQRALTSENPPIRTWGKDEPNLRKRRRK